MKSAALLLATTAVASSSASAFVVPSSQSRAFVGGAPTLRATVEENASSSDFASAVPKEPTVYEKLGFSEDALAIGVEPEEVLKYLGTRDDIIAKFQRDNSDMTPDRAASEVDKFMMDAEMVDAFVKYEKSKLDPDRGARLKAEAEQTLADPRTWATYAAWIGGGAGFAVFKNLYVEPRYASGEWQEIHIALPDLFHNAATEAAVATADAAACVGDACL
uniref:Uncharacterized protein n=1 Tax=Trieres chinensis TaxID=1514140 RepID=A0A7S2EB17_TRICV|mmetsp:Transcript_15713/g.32190  ORF Transcript_15713/g.32190 Transcript_15713/m.32190 type:complete len:219 (+) Transcript_15713:156-812(+)